MILARNQGGFTLVELLLALGITAMIAGILSTAIFRIFDAGSTDNKRIQVLSDLQIAGQWLFRDGPRAETTDLVDAASPVTSMSLSWTSEGSSHTSVYSLSGTELQRDHNGAVISVARNISDVDFSIQDSLLTIVLTSQPHGGSISKQATYHIFLRPNQ